MKFFDKSQVMGIVTNKAITMVKVLVWVSGDKKRRQTEEEVGRQH